MSREKELSSLFILGVNHRSAPLAIREQLAIGERLPLAYRGLRGLPGVEEGLLLNTCNRFECYGVSRRPQCQEELTRFFHRFQSIDRELFFQHSYWRCGMPVIQHLFEVASGIDSQRVGETEILGQVKAAYQVAIEQKSVGSLLHKIFQKSFQAAKWVRTHTQINQGQVSIGTVAVELAERIFGNLRTSQVLLLGLGEVGQQTLKALKSRGSDSISITSRTISKAKQLAEKFGGSALALDELSSVVLSDFDILICSASADRYVLEEAVIAAALRCRPHRPFFIIDLALPRNIPPSVAHLPNAFLYNLDDLAIIADHNQKLREREAQRCRLMLSERVGLLCQSLSLL